MKNHALVFALLLLPLSAWAQQAHRDHISPYTGEEERDIKSLSADDVAELKRGGGWGLAKAAELNGVPGPSHVLAMREALALTPTQLRTVEELFARMQKAAIDEGERLISLEAKLETRFRSGSIDEVQLRQQLNGIGASRANLRYIHLAAHLELADVLGRDQVARYNELRGYAAR